MLKRAKIMNILNDVEASSVLSLKSVQPVRDAGITIENEKKKKWPLKHISISSANRNEHFFKIQASR